jgi:hypothetical protein
MILWLRANGTCMSNVRFATPIDPCRMAGERLQSLHSSLAFGNADTG